MKGFNKRRLAAEVPASVFWQQQWKPQECIPQASHCGHETSHYGKIKWKYYLTDEIQVQLDPYCQQAAHF